MNILLEPLGFEFMRNALSMGLLLDILCAVVGSYMIVQQMGMMGDMIPHSVMAWLPVAVFLGLPLSVGALVVGVLRAVVLSGIESQSRLKMDSVMALILASFLAIGTTLVTVLPGANRIDVMHVLFGNILGVNRGDLMLTFGITLIILMSVWLFYKELLLYTFDSVGAQAGGMRVRCYYLGIVTAISLTVIASLQAVGVLLVIAMLVAPGMTAYLLVKELPTDDDFGQLSGSICQYCWYVFELLHKHSFRVGHRFSSLWSFSAGVPLQSIPGNFDAIRLREKHSLEAGLQFKLST